MIALSARFTDSASGKTAATSGSMSTNFFPFPTRPAYLPLTPSEKSYSRRMGASAFFLLAFFIGFAFAPGRRPCADDSDPVASIGVDDHQKTVVGGSPQEHEALLAKPPHVPEPDGLARRHERALAGGGLPRARGGSGRSRPAGRAAPRGFGPVGRIQLEPRERLRAVQC